jgi:hypothetical protein
MILEYRTTLTPAEVLTRAKGFFASRNPLYAAFLEKEGETFATFRGQGGEELVIGVAPIEGGTAVRASTYLFDMQAQRFFVTLPPMPTPTEAMA